MAPQDRLANIALEGQPKRRYFKRLSKAGPTGGWANSAILPKCAPGVQITRPFRQAFEGGRRDRRDIEVLTPDIFLANRA